MSKTSTNPIQGNSTLKTTDSPNFVVIHRYNYGQNKFVKVFDTEKMPSLTEPDLALSVREILTKHSSVRQLPMLKEPIYDEGLSMLGVNKKSLDLSDLAVLREKNAAMVEDLQKKLDAQKALKDQIEHDKRVTAEVERRLELEKQKAEKGGTH